MNDAITKAITNKNLNNNKYVNTECPTNKTVMDIICIYILYIHNQKYIYI